jgi:hypothetical protein
MNLTISAGPIASLIAGILILIMPRLLNYIIAIYLIIMGVLGLTGYARADAFRADARPTVVACASDCGMTLSIPAPAHIQLQ